MLKILFICTLLSFYSCGTKKGPSNNEQLLSPQVEKQSQDRETAEQSKAEQSKAEQSKAEQPESIRSWLNQNYHTIDITGDGPCWLRSILAVMLYQAMNNNEIKDLIIKNALEAIAAPIYLDGFDDIKNTLFVNKDLDADFFIEKFNELTTSKNILEAIQFLNHRTNTNKDSSHFRLLFRNFIAFTMTRQSLYNIITTDNDVIRQEMLEHFQEDLIKIRKDTIDNLNSWGTPDNIQSLVNFFQMEKVLIYDSELNSLSVFSNDLKMRKKLSISDIKNINDHIIINAIPAHYEILFINKH